MPEMQLVCEARVEPNRLRFIRTIGAPAACRVVWGGLHAVAAFRFYVSWFPTANPPVLSTLQCSAKICTSSLQPKKRRDADERDTTLKSS
jgi:hypothetical protein